MEKRFLTPAEIARAIIDTGIKKANLSTKSCIKLGILAGIFIGLGGLANIIVSQSIGNIDINKGRKNNDFGHGFYCGESYEQSASFVENFENSSVYYFSLDVTGLRSLKYAVDRDWMLTIAYFRGTLNEYKDSIVIKNLISRLEGVDYVVAPIADNKMFRIIDSFINGEITDSELREVTCSADRSGYVIYCSTDKLNIE